MDADPHLAGQPTTSSTQTLETKLKKRLLASLLLASAPIHGFAQSVVVFGTMDLNITQAKVGGKSMTLMEQGGNRVPSRLGFRGVEDLGGGLSASFWLESPVLSDTGAVSGNFWSRRSTMSLSSVTWGEVRLGRDYVPTFWNISAFTPFATVGAGGASNIIAGWPTGLSGATTALRANNMVGYFLPKNDFGLYGQFANALGEGVDGARYRGGRLGYAAGPFDGAIAYGYTDTRGAKYKTSTIGGSYQLQGTKLFANYHRVERLTDRQANLTVGFATQAGPGQLIASYGYSDRRGPGVSADDASQAAIGYVHPLSKRTELYGIYSHINNRGRASYIAASAPAGAPGQAASALQIGVTHRF